MCDIQCGSHSARRTNLGKCRCKQYVIKLFIYIFCFCQLSGELCSQSEDSAQQNHVKACNVPSVILSAYLSTQQQISVAPPVVGNELRSSVPSSNHVLTFSETRTDHEKTIPSLSGVKTSREETATRLTGTASGAEKMPAKPEKPYWSPLLLVVPLRLGLSKITPVYYNAIKVFYNS